MNNKMIKGIILFVIVFSLLGGVVWGAECTKADSKNLPRNNIAPIAGCYAVTLASGEVKYYDLDKDQRVGVGRPQRGSSSGAAAQAQQERTENWIDAETGEKFVVKYQGTTITSINGKPVPPDLAKRIDLNAYNPNEAKTFPLTGGENCEYRGPTDYSITNKDGQVSERRSGTDTVTYEYDDDESTSPESVTITSGQGEWEIIPKPGQDLGKIKSLSEITDANADSIVYNSEDGGRVVIPSERFNDVNGLFGDNTNLRDSFLTVLADTRTNIPESLDGGNINLRGLDDDVLYYSAGTGDEGPSMTYVDDTVLAGGQTVTRTTVEGTVTYETDSGEFDISTDRSVNIEDLPDSYTTSTINAQGVLTELVINEGDSKTTFKGGTNGQYDLSVVEPGFSDSIIVNSDSTHPPGLPEGLGGTYHRVGDLYYNPNTNDFTDSSGRILSGSDVEDEGISKDMQKSIRKGLAGLKSSQKGNTFVPWGSSFVFQDIDFIFSTYQGFQGFSALLFEEDALADWKEGIDKVFAETHLGIQYWTSDICSAKLDDIPSNSLLIDTQSGHLFPAALVQGTRIGPISYVNSTNVSRSIT